MQFCFLLLMKRVLSPAQNSSSMADSLHVNGEKHDI
jgi:hypothetical protein